MRVRKKMKTRAIYEIAMIFICVAIDEGNAQIQKYVASEMCNVNCTMSKCMTTAPTITNP